MKRITSKYPPPLAKLATLAAALLALLMTGQVGAQVTATLTGPKVLPEGGIIAVKYGQCLFGDESPIFTPGNRYCEWRGAGETTTGLMPFARTGRFTVTIKNEGSSDATMKSLALHQQSGSGPGCGSGVAATTAFAWSGADLHAIDDQFFTFSYNPISVAANSTRVIRFEMASRADFMIDGDCVWEFRFDGNVFATLTVEDDDARPYIGPIPGPHPYGAGWRPFPSCLIDGKGNKIRRPCTYVE